MKKTLFIALLGLGANAFAAGSSAAQFLKMGAGARTASMGNTAAAAVNDVTAAYWNPAALSQIEEAQVAVMHNDGLVDTSYEYLGAAMPVRNSVMGLSIANMNYGSIDRYDASNNPSGSFDAGSLAGNLTFSSTLRDNLRWGASAKYIQESIESESASAIALDLGLLMTLNKTKLGATIQNLGQKMEFVKDSYSLPLLIRLGAAHSFIDEKLVLAADASKYNDNDLTYHLGVDYRVASVLSLRGGYQITPSNRLDVDGSTGLTAGIGFQISKLTIDYAFIPFGDLGDTHRLSLLIKFNRFNN